MEYKYLNNVIETERDNKVLISVIISRKDIGSISILSDYNPVTDNNNVIIKVRKNSKTIEHRTFLRSDIFPKHIERTKETITIYLEQFKV